MNGNATAIKYEINVATAAPSAPISGIKYIFKIIFVTKPLKFLNNMILYDCFAISLNEYRAPINAKNIAGPNINEYLNASLIAIS